jgi:hypothetical protein
MMQRKAFEMQARLTEEKIAITRVLEACKKNMVVREQQFKQQGDQRLQHMQIKLDRMRVNEKKIEDGCGKGKEKSK